MNIEGNPFSWDFVESRSMKTLADQASAVYNKPQEVKEQKEDLYDFFGQKFGHSPNPAHVVGITPLDKPPYTGTK